MQAVIGDDALNAAQTDLELALAQFLRHHLGRGLWVQEQIAQDLAHRLVGAAVIGLGAGFVQLEGGETPLAESRQQLIITLAAIAVFLCDVTHGLAKAFAFDEHEEAGDALIGWQDGKRAGGADQAVSARVELEASAHSEKMLQGASNV